MTAYNCVSYNALVGKAPHRTAQAEFIERYSQAHDIDIWFLSEVIGYHQDLLGIDGYRVHQVIGWRHSDNCAILVRDEIDSSGQWTVKMDTTWPRPRMRGTHPARTFITVLIEGHWRAMGIHLPSIKGSPEGKGQRIAAYVEGGDRIVQAVANARADQPWLVVGDWNEAAREAGAHKPAAICRRAGLTPAVSTRIDFPAYRQGRVSGVVYDHEDNGRSDHPVVRFTWEPQGGIEPVSEETLLKMHLAAEALAAEGRQDAANLFWAARRPVREGLPLP